MEMTKKQYKKYYGFKPFLSPTSLKILGIICLTIAQLAMVVFVILIIPDPESLGQCETVDDVMDVLSFTFAAIQSRDLFLTVYKIGRLTAPLLLIGLFSTLSIQKEKIKKLIVLYSILTLLFYAFIIVLQKYLSVRILDELINTTALPKVFDNLALKYLEQALADIMGIYLQVNVFIDLLLATLFYYFAMYVPKSEFWKKHKKVFRSFSLLPIIYVLASLTLGSLNRAGTITLPIYITALLSFKGVSAHVIFISMVLFYKFRRKLYERKKRELSYEDYSKTNLFIFRFAIFMATVIAILRIGDYVIYRIGKDLNVTFIQRLRFGNNIYYAFMIPIILFYNFSIKFRFKYLKILFYLFYALLALILVTGYLFVTIEILDLLDAAAQIILIIKEAASSSGEATEGTGEVATQAALYIMPHLNNLNFAKQALMLF